MPNDNQITLAEFLHQKHAEYSPEELATAFAGMLHNAEHIDVDADTFYSVNIDRNGQAYIEWEFRSYGDWHEIYDDMLEDFEAFAVSNRTERIALAALRGELELFPVMTSDGPDN